MIEEDSQYISVSLTDIVAARLAILAPVQQALLAHLAKQMATHYHLHFRSQSERLKALYRHFNPSIPLGRPVIDSTERVGLKVRFFEQMQSLLVAANYRELSLEEVRQAMDEQALFDLDVSVNLSDYDRLLVFRRGAQHKSMTLPRWLGRFGEREVDFVNYDRVALVFTENTPGSDVHIKLFQNVPRHDIEILLPEPQVRMRLRDKLVIGVPAILGGAVVLLTKLGPTLLLIGSLLAFWAGLSEKDVVIDQGVMLALGAGLLALGGHFWRQFGAVKNRRLAFLKVLTENLYFKSLDNNSGAIQQLLDTAADEEIKEVFLVTSFLWETQQPLEAEELDVQIERWLSQQFNCETNFDVADAANKAVELGLAREEQGRYEAVEPSDALKTLDQTLYALVFPDAKQHAG